MMYGSFLSDTWLDGAQTIVPNEHGDWINQRNGAFGTYIPLEPAKKFDKLTQSFFVTNSSGLKSGADSFCYNSAQDTLLSAMSQYMDDESVPKEECVRATVFRPFQKQWLYYDKDWNQRRYQIPKLFPTGERGENLVICVSGGALLITDVTPDLHFVGDAQCFPLYWYEEKDVDLFGKKTLVRHDGVSDWVQGQARKRYGTVVTKEEIFYYVYGFLHQPAYRQTFAADLKKSLPRIPLVERYDDFKKTSDIGRQLAALHLNYENLEPYPLEEKGDFSDTRVKKMKFGGKGGKDRSTLIVNGTLTLRGIPEEAYRYQVNGRSPIEWAVDRYQVRTDDKSGIVNDPNLWAPDNPRYIPDLIKRLVTLSIKSLALIADLPPFSAE